MFNSNQLLAIDPGNFESAFVYMHMDDFRPIAFGKLPNKALLNRLQLELDTCPAVIEMIASYGMPVGREIFDTCVWIGRFANELEHKNRSVDFFFRKDVKTDLCGTFNAKDANIRAALIDRFADHDFRNGKGTAKNPDWFHGFKTDIWSAYAVGVAYIDHMREEQKTCRKDQD